tara:strand:+ start:33 stop:653 length:621 start_codon:yes stop_codon:yes gene_type:complete
MSITSYSTLKSSIADWLLRDDLTSVVPTFISLSEAQINRDIRDHRMVKRATADVDTKYFLKPSDWIETIRFQLNTSPIANLLFVTPDQASEEQINYTASGKPKFFTNVGTQIEVVPTPDAIYAGELMYYSKVPALSDSNTDNWLLLAAPDIYLYGSLLQAAPYLNDDTRIPVWQGLYRQGVEALKIQDERSRVGSSSLRMRPRAIA